MLLNVFFVVMIFGFMGYCGVEVDIGFMMMVSVVMGIVVDDMIYFLNWYCCGLW